MQFSLGMSEQDEEWAPREDNQSLEKTLKESAERLLQKHTEALEETYRLLNQESFEGFLERMEKARRIFFFGISDSQLIAQEAGNKFMSISGKAYSIADPHMQAVTAASMTEEDFLVFLSYSGATKDNIYTAKIARRAGAGIGCITRFQKSPLSAYCDVVLQSGANEGPMEGGSVSAKIGQMYLKTSFTRNIGGETMRPAENTEKTPQKLLWINYLKKEIKKNENYQSQRLR